MLYKLLFCTMTYTHYESLLRVCVLLITSHRNVNYYVFKVTCKPIGLGVYITHVTIINKLTYLPTYLNIVHGFKFSLFRSIFNLDKQFI
jgi:hypothetical protein